MKRVCVAVGIAFLMSGVAYAKPDIVPGVGCPVCHVGKPTDKKLTEKAAAMVAQYKDLNTCKGCHKNEGGKMSKPAAAAK
jgi:hypothetical protein